MIETYRINCTSSYFVNISKIDLVQIQGLNIKLNPYWQIGDNFTQKRVATQEVFVENFANFFRIFRIRVTREEVFGENFATWIWWVPTQEFFSLTPGPEVGGFDGKFFQLNFFLAIWQNFSSKPPGFGPGCLLIRVNQVFRKPGTGPNQAA